MGMSKIRLLGILVLTIVFAWTMLRTSTEDTSASTRHTFEAPIAESDKDLPTDLDNDAQLVDTIVAVATHLAKVEDPLATLIASSATKAVLDETSKAGVSDKTAQSAQSDKSQTEDLRAETTHKQGSSDSNEVAIEGVSASGLQDMQAANITALHDNILAADPIRELTPEEKEEERKKAEQKKEKEMNQIKQHLEREHEKLREASLRQLEHDPAMQARIKVSLEDIGVVIRTGKDVKGRLAGPLSTWASERTPDNLVIFSDQEDQFSGWQVQDAIKPWIDRPAIRDTQAAKFWREANAPKSDSGPKFKRFNGWNLDALKFVSSVHLGYNQLRQKRDFKWYVFADDDTYWHLPTLVNLLSNLDYEMEYYTGGVSYFGIAFAHGGAGAVVSAGAMKKRFIDHADTIEQYHDIGATAQYGDTNLARAFEAVGIYFDHSFRENFNGENPFHRPLDRALICQHVVTFHHLKLEFFQPFHERVKNLPIMRYIDIMATLSEPSKPMTFFWHKNDWSFNLDREDVGTASEAKNFRENNWAFTVPEKYKDMLNAKACQEMCRDNEKCVAWTFIENERTCTMSEWFRIGQERKQSTSGVDAMKLSDWVDTCSLWWPKRY